MKSIDCICIGASAGGVTAAQQILDGLRKGFSIPIVLVQHISPDAAVDWDLVYGRYFQGKVLEAKDKTKLEQGHAYFAPPSYHLLLERDSLISLSQDEPVHFARPSIDVFFESAAAAFGPGACGVLLSGANQDGAAGLKEIQDAGGLTLVQNPETAESRMMPESALRIMKPDYVEDLKGIAGILNELSWRGRR